MRARTVIIVAVVGFALHRALPALAGGQIVLTTSTERLTRAQARTLAENLDRAHFGGWFTDPRHNIAHVVKIWQHESGLKPDALNSADPTGAWGIGQVLASTAGQFGVTDPTELMNPSVGARTSMEYLRWSWSEFTRQAGREPTLQEWISSYNRGVAGTIRNGVGVAYVASVLSRI